MAARPQAASLHNLSALEVFFRSLLPGFDGAWCGFILLLYEQVSVMEAIGKEEGRREGEWGGGGVA